MARKKQEDVREAIHLLSQILVTCGTPKVPSENFRRAKFNHPSVTRDLWQVLLHSIRVVRTLDEGGTPDVSVVLVNDDNLPIVALRVRCYFLAALGYTRGSFYVGDHNLLGSRELLLAFGWLLHHSRFISKLKAYHTSAVDTVTLPLPASLRQAREYVEENARLFDEQCASIIDTFRSSCDVRNFKNTLQMLACVRGRLLAQWKATAQRQLAYVRKAGDVHKWTAHVDQDGQVISALSVHEVFLLKHPEHMSAYLAKTEKHLSMLEDLIVWELKQEVVFWSWMESVLDLESSETSASACDDEQMVVDMAHLKGEVRSLEEHLGTLLKENAVSKIKRPSDMSSGAMQHTPHIVLASSCKPFFRINTLSPLDCALLAIKEHRSRMDNSSKCGWMSEATSKGSTGDIAARDEVIQKSKLQLCQLLHLD